MIAFALVILAAAVTTDTAADSAARTGSKGNSRITIALAARR